MPKHVYVMDVEKTQRVQIEVRATSLTAAIELANKHETFATVERKARAVAQWPAGEPMTLESDLGNGYRVRRGWFYEVSTSGGRFGHGERKISYAEDAVEQDPTYASFDALLERPERTRYFVRKYGFAASHGDLTTWSHVFPSAEEAYRATRKFVEQSKKFDRDQQRREREIAQDIAREAAMDRVIERMFAHGGVLTRHVGGLWSTSTTYQEGDTFESKSMITDLLEAGLVTVTDHMNQTGDARAVMLSQDGINRVIDRAKIPAALRV